MSHRYLPTGEQDEQKMLEVIGIKNKAALFDSIPERLRVKGQLALPPGETEQRLRELADFFQTVTAWYGQVRQWPTGTLTKFVRAGTRIRTLLGLGG